VRVRDSRGSVELARAMRLERGRHRLVWVPSHAGRHRLRIVALGPAGTRTVVQRTLTAKARRKKRKDKAAKASARERSAARSAR
jgi:hypothetical protein